MARIPSQPVPEALFRYLVVSAVVALELGGRRRTDAVCEVAGVAHPFGSSLRRVCESTVWRWVRKHDQAGGQPLEALARKTRPRISTSLVLAEPFLDFLAKERRADPDASIPELIRRGRAGGHLHASESVDRSTVWRAMQRLGLSTRRGRIGGHVDDMRRFEQRERLQVVLGDFKHFRVGTGHHKRVAMYLLDDATRYCLGTAVSTSEQTDPVLRLLASAVRQYGRIDALYWDHGAGFIADDVAAVCVRLGIFIIFGRVRYPEGHGKIERFNRSLKARLLRGLDGAPEVDPELRALELRLRHDLFNVYNHLPHESLGGDTPAQRWAASRRDLRPIPSEKWLVEAFRLPVERHLFADHTIKFGGTVYEVPRGAGQGLITKRTVTLQRRLLEDNALYLEHQGRSIQLQPVDPHFNATSGRSRRDAPPASAPEIPAKTASMMAFERDYRSMLAADGGFHEPESAPVATERPTKEKDENESA